MADSKKDVSNDVGLALPKSDIGGVPYGLAPRLPITFNRQDGIANIKNYKELAMQNLKMLVLTSPGERVMDPDFGVGLKRFLFQQNVGSTHAEIATRIYNQVQRYLPFLKIEDVLFTGEGPPEDQFNTNLVHIRIEFRIIPLQLSTELELSVENN